MSRWRCKDPDCTATRDEHVDFGGKMPRQCPHRFERLAPPASAPECIHLYTHTETTAGHEWIKCNDCGRNPRVKSASAPETSVCASECPFQCEEEGPHKYHHSEGGSWEDPSAPETSERCGECCAVFKEDGHRKGCSRPGNHTPPATAGELTREELEAFVASTTNTMPDWQHAIRAHDAALRARADAAEKENKRLCQKAEDDYITYRDTMETVRQYKRQRDAAEMRATYHEELVGLERAEVTRLERVIAEAPHAKDCQDGLANIFGGYHDCNCWKTGATPATIVHLPSCRTRAAFQPANGFKCNRTATPATGGDHAK
jgi:hypothetical protein